MSTNGSFSQQEQHKPAAEQYPATSGPTDSSTGTSSGNGDLSKDEVGWYFVEQYYTTLSKSPEKLHLFYGKRSQFVSGLEAEVAPVSVGRSAIQERIRELDFQDCKVRVSNVDSQASFENIVIQVIGETSNKSAELKKFVQTFVLAQQPTGYFVLNDIFRYINEEGDEEAVDAPAVQEETEATGHHERLVEDVEMPKPQASTEEVVPEAVDPEVVESKLEEEKEAEPAVAATAQAINGTSAAVAEEAEVAAPISKAEEVAPEEEKNEVQEETVKEPEVQGEPEQAPVPSTAEVKPAPEKPAAPAKPMSWASRAAAAVVSAPKPAVPAVAAPKTSTPPAQSRPAPPAAQTAKATPPTAAPAAVAAAAVAGEKEKASAATGAGWQSVGSDHSKRQNRPQSISAPPEKEGTMGYVKYVTENVGADELKAALSSYGELIYFDINRQKNCAFVEFATTVGYQAAFAANPHQIAGENIYVEPRRPKAGAYGGNSYNAGRGNLNARGGRGGFEQGRPGSQGGRGNFNQNRGGRGGSNAAPRGGRPAAPTTSA